LLSQKDFATGLAVSKPLRQALQLDQNNFGQLIKSNVQLPFEYSKHPKAEPCSAFEFDLMPVPTI
jgi:hypothetical protein